MSAMPVMIVVLCVMAIAYRYYSAFLAARVATLNDLRTTPAIVRNDGQNYHPTNKWVLFGHHFAAISGAGPLIGPVFAAQFGYLPGLLWIVVGVCLGGAVQDFLTLAASIRRGGRSLAQIAGDAIGPIPGFAAAVAILFILIIALAGLGKVVVKALGGEDIQYPATSRIVLPAGAAAPQINADGTWMIPANSTLKWGKAGCMPLNESFPIRTQAGAPLTFTGGAATWPKGAVRVFPGSAWGTFTIACTIPIALFIGLYLYRLRKGRVLEASIIGGILTLGATVAGGWVAHSHFAHLFNLKDSTIVGAMAIYGFVAAVLPVWVLLCPRDYLSSFLKIGTVALLVIGTLIANPRLQAPAVSHVFASGGPIVPGKIFPFLFITIMCGAISGFHSLVSSGTTSKMIKRETDARAIGYGAMLIEGLVGVVAMIAATTLPVGDYFAMNTDLGKVPQFHDRIIQASGTDIDHLSFYEQNTEESLRGRTSGGVTLAVGMAQILDQAGRRLYSGGAAVFNSMWKYWYHFAIMFEALFILTTIDTGTRIGRFVLQELAGKVIHPRLGDVDWWPGALLSTALIVLGWTYFISANSMAAIWPMFGIANQMLAVIALAVVSVCLVEEGKVRYLWVTLIPLTVVSITTMTAAAEKLSFIWQGILVGWHSGAGLTNATMFNSIVQALLIAAMLVCGWIIIICGAMRVWGMMQRTTRTGITPTVAVAS